MRVLACCWPLGKIGAACNEVLVSHGPRRRGVSRRSLSCTPLSGIGRQSPSSRCSTDLSWSLASSLSATSHSCHSAWSAAKAAASVRPRAFGHRVRNREISDPQSSLGLTPKPPRVASQGFGGSFDLSSGQTVSTTALISSVTVLRTGVSTT